MKLQRVVATSAEVGATRSRKKKAAALAALLAEGRGLRRIVVPWLSGVLPQGKIGVGWAALRAVRGTAPSGESTLTVEEVDDVGASVGGGSAGATPSAGPPLRDRLGVAACFASIARARSACPIS